MAKEKTDWLVRFVLLVEMRGFVLAFWTASSCFCHSAFQNASVIATNNSLDCLLDAFVRIPSTLYVQQNKKAGKLHLPVFLWWRWGDSNPWPMRCERIALPTEPHPQVYTVLWYYPATAFLGWFRNCIALPVVDKHSPLWLQTIRWIVCLTRRASRGQALPRFGYKQFTGLFALRVAPTEPHPHDIFSSTESHPQSCVRLT